MIPIIEKLDTRVLERQIQRAYYQGTKTLPDIVNQRALNVTGRAFNDTKLADKQKIMRELGEIGQELRRTKTGRLVRGKKLYVRAFNSTATRLELIINSRRGKAGLPGLEGSAMEKEVVKVLASRKRAVGFEKSAYFPALRAFAAALPRPFKIARTAGIAQYGRSKGDYKIARPGWKVGATIINNAKDIHKADAGALQRAVNAEALELQRHLDQDIKPIVDAFNNPS